MRARRQQLGLSQAQLAKEVGVHLRQIARYEAGEQQPLLAVGVALAEALGISIAELAGQIPRAIDLGGDWWAAWQTWKDGVERIDVHEVVVKQHGDFIAMDASRAGGPETGSYLWRGELRLWDNEALMGWYRATDAGVRSKGTIYFALHPHGRHAEGRWVGTSYDGSVVSGNGGLARERDHARQLVVAAMGRDLVGK